MMKKTSSRLAPNPNRHRRSFLSSYQEYCREVNPPNEQKSVTQIDAEKRLDKFAESGILVIFYVFLMVYCLYSKLWLPHTMSSETLTSNTTREEIGARIYAERCAFYSSGHAFYPFIRDLYAIDILLMFVHYPMFIILLIHPDVRLRLIEYSPVFLFVFMCMVVPCICTQIISATTCRSIEILLDLRFISILTTQLIGFIGCLLFAYKLGSLSAIKIPENISQDKTLFIPFSQSCVINLK